MTIYRPIYLNSIDLMVIAWKAIVQDSEAIKMVLDDEFDVRSTANISFTYRDIFLSPGQIAEAINELHSGYPEIIPALLNRKNAGNDTCPTCIGIEKCNKFPCAFLECRYDEIDKEGNGRSYD